VRLIFIGLTFFLLVGLISINVLAEPSSNLAPKIGMLLPLSGSYAALGEDNRHGVEIALEVSGKKDLLSFVYEDSKADPNTAVSEFRKLNTVDKVAAFFVMRSPVGMAINPLSATSGVPILGGVGDKKFAAQNKYAFQIWSKSDEEGKFLAATLVERKYSRTAVVTTEDDWTSSVTQGLRDEFKQISQTTVFDEAVLPSDNDFRSIVLRMKSKSPDVIFANLGLAQIGPFIRQLREQNITVPIYSNFWIAKKDVLQSVGAEILEGVKFIEMDTNLPVLRQKLFERFGVNPSGATLTTYIATLLMIQAASELSLDYSPQAFYLALLKQSEIITPDGPLLVRDRCVKFPLVEKVMRNGKSETVLP
jgi:branched-chain amino acid transport system substrate-binding protein